MVVENIDNENNGNLKIVVGSFQGVLRIYYPRQRDYRVEDLILEQELEAPIIQLSAGRFLPNMSAVALAVLHPRKLAVYTVSPGGGSAGQPGYYTLTKNYEHALERTAFNMVSGPFGGAYERDFICIQSLDGCISFFEQDTFAFSRFVGNFLLPGPLCYSAKLDSFITFNSQLEIESYKYQVLASSSSEKKRDDDDNNLSSSKRVQYDWSLNIGEQVFDIQIARFSRSLVSSQVDILVLGERGFYTIKEGGSIRLQKRFDVFPSACCVYNTTEEEAGGANQNLLVSSFTNQLYVFKDMQLLWSAGISHVPVAITVASFGGLAGMVVTLDDAGDLSISYMGTDPPTNVVGAFESNKELNYEEMDEEHRRLLAIIREATSENKADPTDRVMLRAQVPTRLDNIPIAPDGEDGEEWRNRMVTVRLFVSYTGSDVLENVTITISPEEPFTVNQEVIVLPQLTGGRNTPIAIPLIFRFQPTSLPTSTIANVVATYQSALGEPRTARCQISLPLCMVTKVVSPLKNAAFKITLDTNRMPPPLNIIFEDVCGLSPFAMDPKSTSGSVLTFQYYTGQDVTILVSKNAGRYRVQSGALEALWLIVAELAQRLASYFERQQAGGEDPFTISFQEALPLQDYFAIIDDHFKAREALVQLNQTLAERAHQFRSIQKRLLVRFKDRNPAPLTNLDTLMSQTYSMLTDFAKQVEAKQRALTTAGNRLSCATRLMVMLIRYRFGLDEDNYHVLEEYLTPMVVDTQEQGWEECIDAAMTHLLRTSLAKSVKETASTAPVPLAPATDTSRLKKHITLVCDRLSKGAKLYKGEGPGSGPASSKTTSSSASSIASETPRETPRDAMIPPPSPKIPSSLPSPSSSSESMPSPHINGYSTTSSYDSGYAESDGYA